jgi:glycerol-3-phosphate dehydrogenase
MQLPSRQASLGRLRSLGSIDVLIVGGGINGAGLFRELALNGVDALLVDKGDFASGATSASSRMIHGGLRYLENGELALVRESLLERNRLLKNAPHAVKPLPTTIPIFYRWSGFGNVLGKFFRENPRPSRRGAALIKIGLTLYDLFAGRDRVLPRHYFVSRSKALSSRPGLNPAIICTATYYDAWVALPERLCLELVDDALAAHPRSLAVNYVALSGVAPSGDVQLRDALTGEEFAVRPRVVVNATGAWIDMANTAVGMATRLIGGTKGSHLIIDNPELYAATGEGEVLYENDEGRICIFFRLYGKVLVGSTDIRVQNPDEAICDEDEISYMLESVRAVFPAIRIGRGDIVSHFCGVRPLPASDAGFTGRISRSHICRSYAPDAAHPWPLHAMIGGKWTTFRAFAAQVADKVFAELGRQRQVSTEAVPIGGRSPEPNYDSIDALGLISATEAVVHLDDLLLRRTPLALYGALGSERFDMIAGRVAHILGWDEDRLADEKRRASTLLAKRNGVSIASKTTHQPLHP